jgi:hypothetical protein
MPESLEPQPPQLPRSDGGLGSKLVLERVQAIAQRGAKPKPVDVFTGKKICHRFFTPVWFMQTNQLKPQEADLKTLVGNSMCLGEKCSLWDAERLQCLDVSKAQADARVPDLLEQIDGFLRIHSSESGG